MTEAVREGQDDIMLVLTVHVLDRLERSTLLQLRMFVL